MWKCSCGCPRQRKFFNNTETSTTQDTEAVPRLRLLFPEDLRVAACTRIMLFRAEQQAHAVLNMHSKLSVVNRSSALLLQAFPSEWRVCVHGGVSLGGARRPTVGRVIGSQQTPSRLKTPTQTPQNTRTNTVAADHAILQRNH